MVNGMCWCSHATSREQDEPDEVKKKKGPYCFTTDGVTLNLLCALLQHIYLSFPPLTFLNLFILVSSTYYLLCTACTVHKIRACKSDLVLRWREPHPCSCPSQ